jgi:hypothetical protein
LEASIASLWVTGESVIAEKTPTQGMFQEKLLPRQARSGKLLISHQLTVSFLFVVVIFVGRDFSLAVCTTADAGQSSSSKSTPLTFSHRGAIITADRLVFALCTTR